MCSLTAIYASVQLQSHKSNLSIDVLDLICFSGLYLFSAVSD